MGTFGIFNNVIEERLLQPEVPLLFVIQCIMLYLFFNSFFYQGGGRLNPLSPPPTWCLSLWMTDFGTVLLFLVFRSPVDVSDLHRVWIFSDL